MKNKMIIAIIMTLIMNLIPMSILADAGNAYPSGVKSGESSGKIWAERHKNSYKVSNVEGPLVLEEKYIGIYYEENSPSNEYKVEFLRGFRQGFKSEYLKIYSSFVKKDSKLLGEEHGTLFGEKQGSIDGRTRYNSGLNDNLDRDLKSDKPIEGNIKTRYELYSEDSNYSAGFLAAFLSSYEKSYKKAYTRTGTKPKTAAEQGEEDGLKQGQIEGSSVGQQEFEMARTLDALRALNEFRSNKSIESRYFLDKFPYEYRVGFIGAFIENFQSHYNGAYAEYNMTVAEKNINTKRVAGPSETLILNETRLEYSGGSSVSVTRQIGELFIPEAAIYQPTYIGISKIEKSFNYANYKYVPVTDVISISVLNEKSSIDIRKPLTLKIPHFGDEKAGIYQLVNGSWRYLYSDVVESEGEETEFVIKADIPKGTYRGGQYAVFIDENYIPIRDINGTWAKEALSSFMRRGYISADSLGYYNPESSMTRGQFAQLIWAIKGYAGASDSSGKFSDSASFGYYKGAIDYVVSMGYMSGYSNGKFGPNDKISYQQMEWVMRKVLNKQSFNWNTYANKMVNENFKSSASVYGKGKAIKKIEAVYMLYELQKTNSI